MSRHQSLPKNVDHPPAQLLVVTDTAGRVLQASDPFYAAAGLTPAELIGQPIARLRHPEMPKGPIKDLWETLGKGQSWMGMLKNRRADGSEFWVDAYISPITDSNGQILEYQAIYHLPDPITIARAQRIYRIRGHGHQPPELRWAWLRPAHWQLLLASLGFMPLVLLALQRGDLIGWLCIFTSLAAAGLLLSWHNRALEQLTGHCRKLLAHPIKQLIYTGRADAIGQIQLSLRLLETRLAVMITRFGDSNQQITGHVQTANQLLSSSHHGSQQQQDSLAAIAAAVEQFSATIREVAANTRDAARLGSANRTAGQLGRQRAEDARASIQALASELEQATDAVDSLNQHSQSIGRILEVIRAIAEQTNLLALNAAIEAARAGENGRGFAVVADEVRTLAQRTQASTDEIQQMISTLQQGAEAVVTAMHRGQSHSLQSVEHVNACHEALGSICAGIEQGDDRNQQIAAASDQQSQTASEISQRLQHIHQLASTTHQHLLDTLQAGAAVGQQVERQQGLIAHLQQA